MNWTMGSTTGRLSSIKFEEIADKTKEKSMSKFKLEDIVRVTEGKSEGVEGRVIWVNHDVSGLPMYSIDITKATKESGYVEGSADDFGEEFLELVTPDVREVGKTIKPELVKIGDKIRAVRVLINGIEESRGGVVGQISKLSNRNAVFATSGGHTIGYNPGVTVHYVLEEASTLHELTLAPVGTKFKAIRGPGSTCYLIYTKYREGWWISESYDKRTDKFVEITMKSEKTTINEFDKGRSTYL